MTRLSGIQRQRQAFHINIGDNEMIRRREICKYRIITANGKCHSDFVILPQTKFDVGYTRIKLLNGREADGRAVCLQNIVRRTSFF